MKFDNYKTVIFYGENYERVERTKNIYSKILEIYSGSKYDGLGWIVTEIFISGSVNKKYNVKFLCSDEKLLIELEEQIFMNENNCTNN